MHCAWLNRPPSPISAARVVYVLISCGEGEEEALGRHLLAHPEDRGASLVYFVPAGAGE